MQIEYVDINSIKPYKNNPRHNEEAIPYVMNSIKEFGFKNPIIIDKNNVIIAGHTRLESAKRLGMKEVPIIHADDLTEEQVKAFRLADNKVSEKADWNIELLDEEYKQLLFKGMIKADDKFNEIEDKTQVTKDTITGKEEDKNTIVDKTIKVKEMWLVSNKMRISKIFNNKQEALELYDEINKIL